jgi:PAS domain S-box-containing protein
MFVKIPERIKNNPNILPYIIICTLIFAVFVNFYMLFFDQTVIFDPLFYFPIILIAYYYPRRGVIASVGIAVLYLAMVIGILNNPVEILLTSIGHAGFFVIIAFVISYLIRRFPHEFAIYNLLAEIVEQSRMKVIIIPSVIIIFTSVIFLLNFIVLQASQTVIFDPLFYFPVILIAYLYPRRGVSASVVIAVLYLAMVKVTPNVPVEILLTSVGHAGFFVIVGFVISYLNICFSHDGPIHEKFANIVDFSTYDAYSGVTLEGTVTDWNKGAELLYGYKTHEIIGKSIYLLLSPDRPDDALHLHEKIEQGTGVEEYETELMTKDRRRIQISLSVSPIKNYRDTTIGALVLAHNITERKLREAVLRENEARQRAMIANIADVIAIIDNLGIIRYKSENIEKLFGWKPEDLVGRHYNETTHPDDVELIDNAFKKVLTHDNLSTTVEYRYKLKDGKFHTIQLTAKNLVFDPKINGVLVNYHDITEQKLLKDTLMRVNLKLNVLSQLTRKDLTNQIFVLSSYLELAIQDAQGQDRVIERIQNGKNAARVINEIAEFTKDYQDMGAKPPKWQNVNMVFLMGLSHISIGKIHHRIETENLEIFADPLLENVCQRLFENSVAHGNRVTWIRVWHKVTTGGVIIYFEDDGIGIPQDKKEQIFLRGASARSAMRSLIFAREILDITGITIEETGDTGSGVRFEMTVPDGTWRFFRNGG